MNLKLVALAGAVLLAGCATSGTHPVSGAFPVVTMWVIKDGSTCGSVTDWGASSEAFAYEDTRKPHWFHTHAEAVSWLTTNWCKPQSGGSK